MKTPISKKSAFLIAVLLGLTIFTFFSFKIGYIIPVLNPRKNVAVLYIATGRYIIFWDKFYPAAEKYFLPEHNKTYFLFTDHTDLPVPKNVIKIYTPQEPWPYPTLNRYHYFLTQKEKLKKYDYIFFMNANLIFQTPIQKEILPTKDQGIMVALSPVSRVNIDSFTYERNPKSKAYIPFGGGKYYVAGGFNGGTSAAFLSMAEVIKKWIDLDLSHHIIPIWHDESMLNRYLVDYMKRKTPLILPDNYLVPEERKYEYTDIKAILLDKNNFKGHNWMRQINSPSLQVKLPLLRTEIFTLKSYA